MTSMRASASVASSSVEIGQPRHLPLLVALGQKKTMLEFYEKLLIALASFSNFSETELC